MATLRVGLHSMIELFGCPPRLLDDLEFVKAAMREGAHAAKGTILDECVHRFTPQGVTVIGLLAESHISIHTWPEYGFAAADVFTCGETGAPEAACLHLAKLFQASRHELRSVERGVPGGLGVNPGPPPACLRGEV